MCRTIHIRTWGFERLRNLPRPGERGSPLPGPNPERAAGAAGVRLPGAPRGRGCVAGGLHGRRPGRLCSREVTGSGLSSSAHLPGEAGRSRLRTVTRTKCFQEGSCSGRGPFPKEPPASESPGSLIRCVCVWGGLGGHSTASGIVEPGGSCWGCWGPPWALGETLKATPALLWWGDCGPNLCGREPPSPFQPPPLQASAALGEACSA